MFHKVIHGFLGAGINAQLLEYAMSCKQSFQQSKVGATGRYDPAIRESCLLSDLGPFKGIIEQRVLALVPVLIEQLGLSLFTASGVETQIAAHGEGAFYGRHIDLFTGQDRKNADRLISLVYYFYKEPKAFTGGVLRLYPGIASAPDEPTIDILPAQDMAVAFSSWMPHEVMQVSCPSGDFDDFRFAINCWVLRAKNVK